MAGYRKLGRTSDQRKAMLRSQVTALLWEGKVVTTKARAKEVQRIAEKQITKAILTTGIIAGLVYVLQKMGVVAIYIASAALAAYIPLIILLIVLWYIIGKLL